MADRVTVPKTYKLFIDGKFPRSERGRVLAQTDAKGAVMANYAWATRKDLRNAVTAARKAQTGWAGRTAFNRSLILYRIAETLEDRRDAFVAKLQSHAGLKAQAAEAELSAAIDRLFFYAGWADKYAQVLSSVNPVAAPFFNFTVPEPTGVVVAFAPQESVLLGLVSAILPIIVSGNTAVVVVENDAPTVAIDFAEVVAVSDVPAGVVNLLTGKRSELVTWAAAHMDVNAIAYFGTDSQEIAEIEQSAADNVKRVKTFTDSSTQSLYAILPFVEFKTAWHPIGT